MSCHQTTAPERTPIDLMDRVYGAGKLLINQLSIAAVKYQVFEYASQTDAERDCNRTEVGAEAILDVGDVVFDELQTSDGWNVKKDPAGYNFRFTLPAARRPTGNKWHRVEIWLTPSALGAEPYPLVWLIQSTPLASV